MTAYVLLAAGLIWAGLDIVDDVADWWLVWGLLIAVGGSGLLWEYAVNRLSATAQQAAVYARVERALQASPVRPPMTEREAYAAYRAGEISRQEWSSIMFAAVSEELTER